MTDYRYIGIADEVSLSKEDFTRHAVNDQEAVVFNGDNDFTQTLSDDAAVMLKSQGFQMMTVEDYKSFLEQKRAELAEAERVAALERPAPVPPTPSAADLQAMVPAPIPERPGSDADRDTLANYAWTHYMIPVDTADHKMTKAEINKALDKAEKERDQTPEQPVSEEAVATGNVTTT